MTFLSLSIFTRKGTRSLAPRGITRVRGGNLPGLMVRAQRAHPRVQPLGLRKLADRLLPVTFEAEIFPAVRPAASYAVDGKRWVILLLLREQRDRHPVTAVLA